MNISFKPYITNKEGLTYTPVIYGISAFIYACVAACLTYNAISTRRIVRKPVLCGYLYSLVISFVVEKSATAITLIVLQIKYPDEGFWTEARGLLYLFFLWNIAFMHMVAMMAVSGWCIATTALGPNERQKITLVAGAAMICELVLLESESESCKLSSFESHLLPISLIIGFAGILYTFRKHFQTVMTFLKTRLSVINHANRPGQTDFSPLTVAIGKKMEMLTNTLNLFWLYTLGRSIIVGLMPYVCAFYRVAAYELLQWVFVASLSYILWIRKPVEVRVRLNVEGQIEMVAGTATKVETSMVLHILL